MIKGIEIDINEEKEVVESCNREYDIRIKETSKKFENGLKKIGIGMEDFHTNWWYIGGNNTDATVEYVNQWINLLNLDIPDETDKCICGTTIEYNSYATNGTRTIIIGTCCKERFLARRGKVCFRCKKSHKNKKDNYCNECRIKNNEDKEQEERRKYIEWMKSLKSPIIKIDEEKVSLPKKTFEFIRTTDYKILTTN